jgi:hypothetical protein
MPSGNRHTADETFLMAFASGATVEKAAHTAGISVRTAFRRLDDPLIKQRLKEIRLEIIQRGSSILSSSAADAVTTLQALMQPNVPAAVRLGAARALLEMNVKIRETAEMIERFETIEARLNGES